MPNNITIDAPESSEDQVLFTININLGESEDQLIGQITVRQGDLAHELADAFCE
jgi:hypothetical protein